MTETKPESDDQILDDVLPLPTVDIAVPIELDTLQPWHRPRKQFIRERQWVYFARRLIRNEKNGQSLPLSRDGLHEVRYLTIPGIDYLDVRMIGALCNKLECQLTTTGFLWERDPVVARARVREDTLVKAGYTSDRSYTYRRPFEEVAHYGGSAYREMERSGPFHIINVDTCGSLARPRDSGDRRLIDAIFQVVKYQLTYRAGAWLLYLTADARPDEIAGQTVDRLWRVVEENANSDSAFREELLSVFGLSGSASISSLSQTIGQGGEQFLKLVSLGLGKWLLHLARDRSWRMRTYPAYCYSTTPEGNDEPTMACLAFEFQPEPPEQSDQFGVARMRVRRTGGEDRGPSDSVRVVQKVGEIDNLDVKMRDQDLRREMLSRTKSLLKEAGYACTVLERL